MSKVLAPSQEVHIEASGLQTKVQAEVGFTPPTLASETVAHIGTFELRNSLLMVWIVMLVLIIPALILRKRRLQLVPSGLQNFVEMLVEGFFNFWTSITKDREQTRKFFPLVTTIFIFVITSNWLGIFPGVGPIGLHEVHEGHPVFVPLLRSGYADINFTLALALISVIATQVYGIKSLGFFHYAGKFFKNPLKDPIGAFVGILELVSEFAKIVSFSFRLFGNIFAGEMLLVVMGFLMPFLAPLPFYGLEIFVGFVQALVFSLLTLVFLKMAVAPHAEH